VSVIRVLGTEPQDHDNRRCCWLCHVAVVDVHHGAQRWCGSARVVCLCPTVSVRGQNVVTLHLLVIVAL